MSRYRKLDLRTWNDLKFRELSRLPCSGQSVWLVLVLGPQTTNIPGLFEASDVAIADRFGWKLEDFREAFKEASSKGMAKADWKSRLVWLPKAPEYNKPESPNVVKSWGSSFDELPECSLKFSAYHTLRVYAEGWGKPFLEAFDQAFRKPSSKALPNQEQEQEQKQEQDLVPSEPVALERATDPPEPGPVEKVFQHWQEVHRKPRAKLDDKRRALIRKALKHYSEADLCQSISGYLNSPHHMGQNDKATVYDDIELMLRDSKHVDAGLKFYAEPPRTDLSAKTRAIVAATEHWVPPESRHAGN